MSRHIAKNIFAEDAPQEPDKRLRRLIESIPMGVGIFNLKGDIIEANSKLWLMFGFNSKDELLETSAETYWLDLKEKERFVELNQAGNVGNFEAKFHRKDSTVFWASINSATQMVGAKSEIIGFFQDITRKQNLIEILQESEQKYRGMAERTLDPIAAMTPEGHFGYLSPAAEDIFNTQLVEMIGQHIGTFIPENDLPKVNQAFSEVMSGRNVEGIILEILRKDGLPTFVEVSAAPMIEIEDREPVGIQTTFRDITERKLAEEKLKRQKEELSEFAHAMHHDLRNYLIVVKGFADLLQSKPEPMHAERICTVVTRIEDILQRSVDLADAGLIAEKADSIDLNCLIRDLAKVTIPDSTAFNQGDLPTVMGDYNKLTQVFKNLFENAVTHGGAEKITVCHHDLEDGICIDIINDGTPIPAHHRSQIFRRGFTTKKGGGLGLSIVKKLIEAHDWKITLEDVPKTTFRIYIPAI